MKNYKNRNCTVVKTVLALCFSISLLPNSAFASSNITIRDSIVRKKLMLSNFPQRPVSRVDARQIDFNPLQQTGRHLHPIPVTGYIVSGTVLFQVEGQSPKTLKAGDVFFEPANKVILHFDNPSSTQPLTFIAFYLLNGHEPLIKMLPETKVK